ncbi:MAG: serine protease [Deltaproteobacteria bacterium]|nr:MAG: serine protease [Deltaproteobacteria bacterium]
MRLAPAALACLLSAALTARADDAATGPRAPVIGGDSAKPGQWPDVAAILFPLSSGDEPLCTGTLIAPSVVITAAHCYDPRDPPLPDNVLIGTSSLARKGDGETIAIKRAYVYPDPSDTEDIAVLVLARPSSRAPRKIATGWGTVDIVNGAPITVVGFGAIDPDGMNFVNELQEATTTITDADCSASSGCNPGAQPAGELGAGGMGKDTCPGDSGGPLYLMTSYGPILAGVTSRAYDNATRACADGGIYVRPDKVIDWIERVAGDVANIGAPQGDTLVAVHGDGDDTRIRVNDPASDAHSFEVIAPPAHGTASVRSDGAVRVCIDAAAAPGADQLTVMVTDTRHAHRAMPLTIPIEIKDGTPPARCDVNAFSEAGCCDAGGRPGAAIPLALGVLALVQRRRRPR